MVNGKNPAEMTTQMMQSNPTFAKFVEENRGLSAEKIMQKYNLPVAEIQQFLNMM